MIGEQHGKWTVIDGPFLSLRKRTVFRVRCACGAEYERHPYQIRKNRQCRVCAALEGRLSDWEATVSQTYHAYLTGANRRGHPFGLTREEFAVIIALDCEYCGAPPANQYGKNGKGSRSNGSWVGKAFYQGIDRRDNTKGYTPDNVVPCCKICNRAKNNLSYEEWINYLDRIASKRG